MKAVITIPTTLDRSVTRGLAMLYCGGYTEVEGVGSWRDPAGEIHTEAVVQFHTICEDRHALMEFVNKSADHQLEQGEQYVLVELFSNRGYQSLSINKESERVT